MQTMIEALTPFCQTCPITCSFVPGVPKKYKCLKSSCEGALPSKMFLFQLTKVLQPQMFKSVLYSQSNSTKQAKFLKQTKADGY